MTNKIFFSKCICRLLTFISFLRSEAQFVLRISIPEITSIPRCPLSLSYKLAIRVKNSFEHRVICAIVLSMVHNKRTSLVSQNANVKPNTALGLLLAKQCLQGYCFLKLEMIGKHNLVILIITHF